MPVSSIIEPLFSQHKHSQRLQVTGTNSPDLAPTDFHLFRHLQLLLRDKINSIIRRMLKMHSMNFLSQEIQISLKKE